MNTYNSLPNEPVSSDSMYSPNRIVTKHPILSNATLLVIDNNVKNYEYLPEFLRQVGMFVDCAENGAEGLEMINKNTYSVVLMDVHMPIMDGFEATRQIRANPRFATLPIIAMTASTSDEDIADCLASGMNAHIGKPVDFNALFELIAYWVTKTAK
jgi:CheY-like chemotaxis protein